MIELSSFPVGGRSSFKEMHMSSLMAEEIPHCYTGLLWQSVSEGSGSWTAAQPGCVVP